jgi:predicted phage tail protein
VTYDVQWRKDGGQWASLGEVAGLSADIGNVIPGDYIARVRSRSASGDASVWAYSGDGNPTFIEGKVGALEAPTLTAIGQLFAVKLTWAFSTTQNQTDNAYTEIVYSTANNFDTAVPFGKFAYPLNIAVIDGLQAVTQYWAWARVVDKSGNTSFWAAATATTTSTADLFQPI